MQEKWLPTWMLSSRWLQFFVIVLLMIGVYFRFVNLDRKVYWCDETFTSLRIAGYTSEEVIQQVFNQQIIDLETLQKYQRPNLEKNTLDTIKGLAVEEPQHSPLYYVLARYWVQIFGDSVTVTRSISVLISLLTFPAIYWLCLELFDSPLIGWISIVLVSISSFHILYAQEAREYSLWTVSILFASASLLRAMRRRTDLSWGVYAVALTFSLYSFLFSVWMAISHGIYVILIERLRLTKTVIAYGLASILGLIFFAPWFLLVLNSYHIYTATDWVQTSIPIFDLFGIWLRNLTLLFFDNQIFNIQFYSFSQSFNFGHPLTFISFFVLGLVVYSTYFLWQHALEQTKLFILTLIGSTALPVILIDLSLGWHISTIIRYLIPSCLGIQLTVAYFLAAKISGIYANVRQQKIWLIVLIILILGGILSGVVSSQSKMAWNKGSTDNPQIAEIVNQSKRPLVMSYSSAMCEVFSLSYLLHAQTKLLLFPRILGSELLIPNIDNQFTDIFLFDPHKVKFGYEIETQDNSQRIISYKLNNFLLWKILKK